MDTAEARFRAATARADRLYDSSGEGSLLSPTYWSAAGEEPTPRPDLAVASLTPAAFGVIERYLNVSPASLAAELADGHFLTAEESAEPPLVFTFTSRSGTTLFCHCAYQAGLTSLPALDILHPEILPFFSLALGTRSTSQYLHFMSLFYKRRESRGRGRFAFKLTYSNYLGVKSSAYWRYWAPQAFYVRLRRVNLEKQAASLYKALVTNQWSSFQNYKCKLIFNLQKLLDAYDSLLEEEKSWDWFYEECPGTAAATLFFEELKVDPIEAVRDMVDRLYDSSLPASGSIRLDQLPTAIQSDSVDEVLENLIRSVREVSTADMVRRVYQLVLERSADVDGLNYWTDIAERQGFEAILGPIFRSDERRNLKETKRDASAVAQRVGKEPNGALCDPYYGHRTVQDILALENNIDVLRDIDFRMTMTTSCRDCEGIPKIADAGHVLVEGKETVQVMHNGIRVLADGYYGPWMTEIIARLRGHHEPQEELVFHQVLQLIRDKAIMLELGGFWSYYSMWFLQGNPSQRRAFVIEPDPNHLAVGRRNAELNGLTIQFTQAAVGRESREAIAFPTETAGPQTIKQISMRDFVREHQIIVIDILHCDAQGVEFDVLQSCESLFREQRIGFAFISTHDKSISGDPLTHQRCLAFLRLTGARILAEHDVHESYSGDGLIVAYSGKEEIAWPEISLSYNRYSTSLSRNPLIDLALARSNLA